VPLQRITLRSFYLYYCLVQKSQYALAGHLNKRNREAKRAQRECSDLFFLSSLHRLAFLISKHFFRREFEGVTGMLRRTIRLCSELLVFQNSCLRNRRISQSASKSSHDEDLEAAQPTSRCAQGSGTPTASLIGSVW